VPPACKLVLVLLWLSPSAWPLARLALAVALTPAPEKLSPTLPLLLLFWLLCSLVLPAGTGFILRVRSRGNDINKQCCLRFAKRTQVLSVVLAAAFHGCLFVAQGQTPGLPLVPMRGVAAGLEFVDEFGRTHEGGMAFTFTQLN